MTSPGTTEISDGSNRSLGSAPAQPSGRKGSKKVRTGCVTCKIRKVKCDEAKPFCLRCIQTGRKCDGYRPMTKRMPGAAAAGREPRSSRPNAVLSSIPWLETAEEKLAFEYYVNWSATSLAGSFGAPFWAGLVPKLCHSEPAVRHAMLALSSIHKTYGTADIYPNSLAAPQFSFEHYGKAMTCLRTASTPGGDTAVPLLVCVIFVAIEFLLADEAASQLHICQGRQILADLQRSLNSPMQSVIVNDLVPMYTRLSLAAFLFGRIPAPIPEHLRETRQSPSQFRSMMEASRCLYGLLDDGLRFSRSARPLTYGAQQNPAMLEALVLQQEDLIAELTQWHAAFSVLVATSAASYLTATDAAPHILQIYYNCALIWVSTGLSPLETAYDSHVQQFAAIVSASRVVVDSYRQSGSSASSFSFESEVVGPLYYCATKCRHPQLRRAAIHLLKSKELGNRRENLWDPELIVAVSERVVELEEGHVQVSSLTAALTGDAVVDEALDKASQVPLDAPPSLDYRVLDVIPWQLEKSQQDTEMGEGTGNEQFGSNVAGLSGGGRSSRVSEGGTMSTDGRSSTSDGSGQERIAEMLEFAPPTDYYPPFGLPEHARVKNTVMGPKSGRDSWVSFFQEPLGNYTGQWDVRREFITARKTPI